MVSASYSLKNTVLFISFFFFFFSRTFHFDVAKFSYYSFLSFFFALFFLFSLIKGYLLKLAEMLYLFTCMAPQSTLDYEVEQKHGAWSSTELLYR